MGSASATWPSAEATLVTWLSPLGNEPVLHASSCPSLKREAVAAAELERGLAAALGSSDDAGCEEAGCFERLACSGACSVRGALSGGAALSGGGRAAAAAPLSRASATICCNASRWPSAAAMLALRMALAQSSPPAAPPPNAPPAAPPPNAPPAAPPAAPPPAASAAAVCTLACSGGVPRIRLPMRRIRSKEDCLPTFGWG